MTKEKVGKYIKEVSAESQRKFVVIFSFFFHEKVSKVEEKREKK